MTRRRHAAVLLALVFAGGAAVFLLCRGPVDRRASPPLGPEGIAFPSLSGRATATLEQAKGKHRAALDFYRRSNRSAGDREAHEALDLYAAAGALVPALSDLHFETIASLAAEDRYDAAARAAETWLQRFPQDRLHREALAKALYRSGRHAEAAVQLESLLAEAGEDPSLLRKLVDARTMQGDQVEGLRSVERLLRAAPRDDPETLRTASRALLRFQEYARALPLLERLASHEPGNPQLKLDLGMTLRALGRHADAIALLEPLGSDPEVGAQALLETALCRAKESQPAEAARLFCTVLEREPSTAQAYHQLAQAMRRLGKDDSAEHMERAAKSLASSERERARAAEQRSAGLAAESMASRARSLALARRFREADAALNEASLRRSPILALHRARLYLEWIRAAEAREVLQDLAGMPDPPAETAQLLTAANELLATGRASQAQLPASSADLIRRIAGTRWPAAAPLLVELSRSELATDRRQAIVAARLACAADPRHAEAWRTLAQLLTAPEEVFWRLDAWKELAALHPADEEARQGVASCRSEVDGLLQ